VKKPEAMVVQMLPTATDLVIQVRDREQKNIAELLEPMGVQELRTLAVLLAAMVPAHANILDLVAWVNDPSHLTPKKCGHCGRWKPSMEFTVDRGRPDGRRTSCKACDAAARRAIARKVAA
jgi:hypothetical protein